MERLMKAKLRQLFIPALLLLLLGGCASTQVADSWTNPDYANQGLNKVLVLGVANDETKRYMFETDLASALKRNGVDATAGSSVRAFRGQLNKDKVVEALKAVDFDNVFVTRISSYDIDKKYYGGYTEYWISGVPTMGGYWTTNYHETTHPDYISERTTLFLETSLFNATDGTLIWSARTKTKEPENNDVIKDLVSKVVPRLKRDGLIR